MRASTKPSPSPEPVHAGKFLRSVPEILMEADPPRLVEPQQRHAYGLCARRIRVVAERNPHSPAQVQVHTTDHRIVDIHFDVRAAVVQTFEVSRQRRAIFVTKSVSLKYRRSPYNASNRALTFG